MMISFILSLLLTKNTFALEIDEKLTTRFLKVSKSMRTVLVNRGLEDGLVVGDHAKFFLTTGVIARGYVVKASPTRTIWSIYRLVNTDKLYKDMAVNLKITNPVEVTNDPSKSLYAGSLPQTQVQVLRGDAMTLDSASSEKESMGMKMSERDEMREVMTEAPLMRIDKTRSWEVFTTAQFSSLSGTVTESNGSQFNSTDSKISYSLGVEKYFSSNNIFLRNLSLFGLVSGGGTSTVSTSGSKIENSFFEYGGGANFHFLSSPFSIGKIIPYITASFGLGSVSSTESSLGSGSTITNGTTVEGSTSFVAFGVGIKYFTSSGFGMRAIVDLYNRSEAYTFEDSSNQQSEVKNSISGPRFLVGLAYRW